MSEELSACGVEAMMSQEAISVGPLAPPVVKWNERGLQDAVYIHCALKSHELIVPNSCMFAWEADLLSVTKAGFVHEFEIKVTRADFKADAKKSRAKLLRDPTIESFYGFGKREVDRPNYFYYAVPKDLIAPDEVPEYAGLIYVNYETDGHRLFYGITSEVKKAARLHSTCISDANRHQLMRALSHRYWKQRLGKSQGQYED